MLTSVTFQANGLEIDLPLSGDLGGLYIEDIEGLDPVEATIVTADTAGTVPGTIQQSVKRVSRDIVFTIGLDPDWASGQTVRLLRQQLYNLLMPQNMVTMIFYDDDADNAVAGIVNIQGQVETFTSTLFAKDPTVAISVYCFNPDFIDPNFVTENLASVTDTTTQTVAYEGSVDTGIECTIDFTAAATDATIYVTTPDGVIKSFLVTAAFIAGDSLYINTNDQLKAVTFTRSGIAQSYMWAKDFAAQWLKFAPGTNLLRVVVSNNGTAQAAVPYILTYYNRHGGL